MNRQEIKSILAAHRPGQRESSEEMEEALAQARRDPELRQWLASQHQFHSKTTDSLRAIPIPDGMREQLLRQRRIISIPWWRLPVTWAAAAALAVLATFMFWQFQRSDEAPFATYRSRMVRTVLRQYTMDVVTNDMRVIQRFLADRQAPADYVLPAGLASLPPTGAGVLSWQGRPVSMVCLNGGKQGTLFLFIADANSVAQAPSGPPAMEQVSALGTVSWQHDGKLYVLAGPADSESLRRYL